MAGHRNRAALAIRAVAHVTLRMITAKTGEAVPIHAAIRRRYRSPRPVQYDAFLPKFEAVCADYVVQTMRRLGWSPSAGESIDGQDLAQWLGVVSRHRRLFDRLLAILGEDGILSREPRGWRVDRELPEVCPAQTLEHLKSACPPGDS